MIIGIMIVAVVSVCVWDEWSHKKLTTTKHKRQTDIPPQQQQKRPRHDQVQEE